MRPWAVLVTTVPSAAPRRWPQGAGSLRRPPRCARPPTPLATRARRTPAPGRAPRRTRPARRRRSRARGRRARPSSRAAVGQRQRVLGEIAMPSGFALAAVKARALDEPGGRRLDLAVGVAEAGRRRVVAEALGGPGSSAAKASPSRTGFVKNEPAETVSGSSGSRTMPLPRRSASTASRTAASGARSPRLDAQRAGELGVADRRGALGRLAGRSDREDHPAPRRRA